MKLRHLLALCLAWQPVETPAAQPLGTTIVYTGQLNDGGQPATGIYDFQVVLFDSVTNGTRCGPTNSLSGTFVTNGTFIVALDFGPGAFNGDARWIETSVRTNGAVDFTSLLPRQVVGVVPYALLAATASTAKTMPAAALTGTVSGSQIAAGSISASKLTAGSVISTKLAPASVATIALADGSVTPAKISTLPEVLSITTFTHPAPEVGSGFGSAQTFVGTDRVLVSAMYDDTGAPDTGAAFLFDLAGHLLTTFTNPTPVSGDYFGYSSMAAVGPDKVLIGAPLADIGATDSGVAYLFNTNGTLLTVFTNPSPAVRDRFAYTLAAVGMDRVLISAIYDDTGATDAGVVYLFDLNGRLLTTFTNPTPAADDQMGWGLAAVGTNRVLICAPHAEPNGGGSAYLFDLAGNLLATCANPSPSYPDRFGINAAAVGTDKVLIGAHLEQAGGVEVGAAYLFDLAGHLLTTFTNPTPATRDWFGGAVAAVGTNRVLIIAYGDDTGAPDAGIAYLFDLTGKLLLTLPNPVPLREAWLGRSQVAATTNRLLIGGGSVAYLFNLGEYAPGFVADGVRAGSITTTSLADGAVTETKLESALAANLALLNANQTFTGTNRFVGPVVATDGDNQFAGTFNGDGAGLVNIPAANLTGTLGLAQLPASLLTNNATSVSLSGMFTGDGAGLTNLLAENAVTARYATNAEWALRASDAVVAQWAYNAGDAVVAQWASRAQLADWAGQLTGPLPDEQLSTNVALLYTNQTFSGVNRFTNAANSFAGDGSGLMNLNADRATNAMRATEAQHATNADFATRATDADHADAAAFAANAANAANAALLNGFHATDFWQLAGNAQTIPGQHFLGTTDNQRLELHVNNQRALLIEPVYQSPNLIGGSIANIVNGSQGVVICGGGNPAEPNIVSGDYSAIGGGVDNQIESASFAMIGGGQNNRIYASAAWAILAGGSRNVVSRNSSSSVLTGGSDNEIGVGCSYSFLGAGEMNRIGQSSMAPGLVGGMHNSIETNSSWSFLGGGQYNSIGAEFGAITGGENNIIAAAAPHSVIGGGATNRIEESAAYATIGGGSGNTMRYGHNSTIAGGDQNRIFMASLASIGGGSGNVITMLAGTISGGWFNAIDSESCTIGGGEDNKIVSCSPCSTIGGGSNNMVMGYASTIAGGDHNSASADSGTIGGGSDNSVTGYAGTISGGWWNSLHSESGTIGGGGVNSVWQYSDYSTVSGGMNNCIQDYSPYSTIPGGEGNVVSTYTAYCTITGGRNNVINSFALHATICGGYQNTVGAAESATIGGGSANSVSSLVGTIGGGTHNKIEVGSPYGTIGGGAWNWILTNALDATVGGGSYNWVHTGATGATIAGGSLGMIGANAAFASIPGGLSNTVAGSFGFASGRRAKANQDGAFVWADSNDFDFASTNSNSFSARAVGGVLFVSAIDDLGNATAGVQLPAGGGSWSALSDRNAKDNFAPVDARNVLEKVATMPVTTWNLKSQSAAVRHIGPMAQDFAAAFGVGEDERHISTSDADGVALAAIQGLNQKLEEKNAALVREIAELRALVKTLAKKVNGGGQ